MTTGIADRVKETTTTVGAGTYTLGGAVQGYRAFSSVFANAQSGIEYCITDGTNWEVGTGTFTLSGTTLSRDVIRASSNGGIAVGWGAGPKYIWNNLSAGYLNFVPYSGATQAVNLGVYGLAAGRALINAAVDDGSNALQIIGGTYGGGAYAGGVITTPGMILSGPGANSGNYSKVGINITQNTTTSFIYSYSTGMGDSSLIFGTAGAQHMSLDRYGTLDVTGSLAAATVKCATAGGFVSSDNSAGITTTVTTSSLVGKTITIKDGLIVGFA